MLNKSGGNNIELDTDSLFGLYQTLVELGNRGQENAVRNALRRTAKEFRKVVVSKTPVVTGALKKAWASQVLGGIDPKAYVWVRNANIAFHGKSTRFEKTRDKKGRLVYDKNRQWIDNKTIKNPYFYAARVENKSRWNKGFFQRSIDSFRPVANWIFEVELKKAIDEVTRKQYKKTRLT